MMETKPLANEHQILRLDIGAKAADALMDTRGVGENALKSEVLMQISFEHTPYVPDINGVYPFHLRHEDNVLIVAICKVRAYNKVKEVAGWFVGIITPDELTALEEAEIEERDALMLDMLAVTDEIARQRWVAHY